MYSRTILSHPREEHVGGSHPYKKIKIFLFLGLDNNPIITYKQISCNNNSNRKEYIMQPLRKDHVDHYKEFVREDLKNGVPSVHPLRGSELRALRKLARDYPDSPYLFVTERKGPMTTSAVRKVLARAGQAAKVGLPIHPHMLRHSTGYKLANDGHDTRAIQHYLGHKNIQHTVRYTELAADRFKDFWKD